MSPLTKLMTPDPVCCAPTDDVLGAVDRMTQCRFGAVLVVDHYRLIGIFTERDLVTRVVAHRADPAATQLHEVMTPRPVCARLEDSLDVCLARLRSGAFRHLPVIDSEGRPIGMLSMRDVLSAMDGGVDRLADDHAFRETLAEGEDPYARGSYPT